MSFFSKKIEVNLEDFCRDFYEKYYLNPGSIVGIDFSSISCETTKRFIVEADLTFDKIDLQKFAAEIMLLRFELFALAWLHQFEVDLAIRQSVFTKNYLNEAKRDDI